MRSSFVAQRSHICWLLIFWIFVVSAVGYINRVNISIAGQAIAKDFGLSNVQLGWVFSAFVPGHALFQAPAGLSGVTGKELLNLRSKKNPAEFSRDDV